MEHTISCTNLHGPIYKLLVAVLRSPDAGCSASQLVGETMSPPKTGQQEAK